MTAPGEGAWRRPRLPLVLAPAVIGFVQLIGTVRAADEQTGHRAVDWVAVVLVLVGPASLWLLRRNPVPVLWWVSAVTVAYLLADYAYGPIFLSLAVVLIGNVLLGHRTAAWLAAGTVYLALVGLRDPLRDEPWSWLSAMGAAAWVLLVLSVAELVRVRRDRALDARRARAEVARRQAGEERLRIARELHDVVAHHMSLINVQAGVALHLVDRKPEQAQTALAAIKDASKEALGELRALVGVLRDEAEAAPRAPVSMLDSLDGLTERSAHAGLELRTTIDGEARPLPAAVQLAAFRIVQEAITNVVRHAGAKRADVRLRYGPDTLAVRVDDDGGPVRLDGFEEGSGLRGMRERAAALDGALTISASPAGGLRVEASLPTGERP